MSKAFTRESDDAAEESIPLRLTPALPPGVKNYLTADGARRLQNELKQLTEVERPKLVASGDPEATKRELFLMDQRIAHLGDSLQNAVVVEPVNGVDDEVRFGATVTVRDKAGIEFRYRLVGIDETDTDRDWISWRSPLAQALLKKRVGERVRIRLPARQEEFEIMAVTYETF